MQESASPRRGRPLREAIRSCELRWFHETAAAAKEGEANQMALLGHMYTVGYGCKPDPDLASKWFAEASKRLGYNVLSDQPPLMSSTAGPPQQQQQQQLHQQQQQQQGQQQARQQQQRQTDPGGQASSSNSSTAHVAAAAAAAASREAAAGMLPVSLAPPPPAATLQQLATASTGQI